jgi:hypothetical protein
MSHTLTHGSSKRVELMEGESRTVITRGSCGWGNIDQRI